MSQILDRPTEISPMFSMNDYRELLSAEDLKPKSRIIAPRNRHEKRRLKKIIRKGAK